MTPRPPKSTRAALVELSPATRAVIYGRGSVIVIRGKESTTLSDAETGKLVAAREAFLGPTLEAIPAE